ncbi:MAG TPA: hypothetical protein DHV48_07725 [Prolixibacteraceae bacterium]|nr:hypothetical protein [Prolixibacteraceae bacterium]
MTDESIMPVNEQGSESARIIFWDSNGEISPHLLFDYYASIGIGNYFVDDSNKKNSDPIIVMINGNIVYPVNVGYLLDITKNYILENTQGNGTGKILDSLHKKTGLFGDKNLKLLPTLHLDFLCDTQDTGFFFFRNGVVKVTAERIQVCNYEDFDTYVWEQNIIQRDFYPIDSNILEINSEFLRFLKDLTVVNDSGKAITRYKALSSAIGYLLHRYKNPTTTKAIILLDVYVDGMPNGGSGKTLLVTAVGKIRNVSVIDGKKYDQKEWFGLSSVELNTEVLLFDDTDRNFNFELIFPLMTTGMFVRRKYKNHVFVPFDKSPKVAITTNYAINGNSSSFRRRMYEFEISATYSADFSPRDKFGKNFFDDWNDNDWNLFYNTMFHYLQVFLREGLIESEPINLQLTKLINRTSEEFVDWADKTVRLSNQYDKKHLYDLFVSEYPDYRNRLKQRDFTYWLRFWGDNRNFKVSEGHSNEIRYIQFSTNSIP